MAALSRVRLRINIVGKKRKNLSFTLDGRTKKRYNGNMENNTEISKNIAKNLIFYRKEAGLTQAELAEKINYSDKSVSKWESGNGVPDVYTLMQMAELYGVTLNDLVGEGTPVLPTKERRGLRGWIMLLASGIVWLVATCLYVLVRFFKPDADWWFIFLYAIAVNAIVIIVFACVWKYRVLNFFAVSALIWTGMLCLHITLKLLFQRFGGDERPLWLLYILGVPLQILEIMWVFFRSRLRKKKQASKGKDKEKSAENAAENIEKTDDKEATE